MSDGTPTVGDLEREIETLKTQGADRDARIEELEEREGLSDGEGSDERIGSAVREGIQDAERRKRRRTTSMTMNDGHEETYGYEDPTPSFVGEDGPSEESDGLELVADEGGLRAYQAPDGYYVLTGLDLRVDSDGDAVMFVYGPDHLRELAGRMEGRR